MIGDFKTKGHSYKGWLEKAKEKSDLKITNPNNKKIFYTALGGNKSVIKISGTLKNAEKFKDHFILVVIRTDRDYPQVIGKARRKWSFSGCTLGGVDHDIYAVLIDQKDKPKFRSKVIQVRLIQS